MRVYVCVCVYVSSFWRICYDVFEFCIEFQLSVANFSPHRIIWVILSRSNKNHTQCTIAQTLLLTNEVCEVETFQWVHLHTSSWDGRE